MNALENVALPLSFRRMPKEERMKKADEMLDLMNLNKHKNHRPNQMSGGQQQRVGVERALVVDPKIIFADDCEIIGLTRRNSIKIKGSTVLVLFF